jgi:hypothetical protein
VGNFFSSTDALDALCIVMIAFLTILAGLMIYNGNIANLTMLLGIEGFFTTLYVGKQIPTASATNTIKALSSIPPQK